MGVAYNSSIVTSGLVLALDAANPKNYNLTAVEVLVVAGGGGGGGSTAGGGGGGGVLYSSAVSITPGSAITATVGDGGAGTVRSDQGAPTNTSGGNSVFGALTAIGGGRGYSGSDTYTPRTSAVGGSGGGGGYYSGGLDPKGSGTSSAGTAGQGFAGGDGAAIGAWGGGGGGGAGGAGGAQVSDSSLRVGGPGLGFNISGTLQYYAGGGGGGAYSGNFSLGGIGGGGNGGDGNSYIPTAGATNTGGGGGGGGFYQYGPGGGAGGSGIVIVRYQGPQRAIGGTVTSVGGYTIHTFITSGTFTPLVATNNSAVFGLSDFSGNNNFATANGLTYATVNEGALSFDGGDASHIQIVNTSGQLDFPGDFTVSLWIYPTQYHRTYQTMIDTYPGGATNGWIFTTMYGGSQVISWYTEGSSWQPSSTAVTLNAWNCLSASRIGTTVKLYKNATEIHSHSDSSNIRGGVGRIGRGLDDANNYGNVFGKISNVQIYKGKGLSAAEISQNFNALRGRFVPADPGNGGGWSIAQGAISTNGSYTSTSSTNYISSWYNSAGGNGTPLNYTCSGSGANFAYHTGHNGNSSQWPMYHAIQVSTDTCGQVINRINWYKHTNACGNVDMWGTTRAITSGNYTDTSLYTYLGRVNMGGSGSAGDCNISSGTFNSSSYGYNWILLQVQDISGTLSYPSVGTLGGWAMYGMQLVKQ